MNIETYYGMDFNPFTKEININCLYQSNDYKQMENRLDFLIRSRGIGVFLSNPGMGKTTSLRNTLSRLNKGRYKVIYLCLTTITVLDFYRQLNDALGLTDVRRKSKLFEQIQDELRRLIIENKTEVVIAIDEVQYLVKDILKEFVMLLNFDYDSKDYCTLILTGQNEFMRVLRFKELESFRQRININYTFTGMDEKEVKDYIQTRLKLVHCRNDIFSPESYHTLYTLMQGSIRYLNQLINKALIIGQHQGLQTISSEIIMQSREEAILQ